MKRLLAICLLIGAAAGTAYGATETKLSAEQRERDIQNFGLSPEQIAKPKKVEKISSVRLQIAQAVILEPGRIRVLAANGAVWDQVENIRLKEIKPGDRIFIKRSFMGGWICKIGNQEPYRCARVDRPYTPEIEVAQDEAQQNQAPVSTPTTDIGPASAEAQSPSARPEQANKPAVPPLAKPSVAPQMQAPSQSQESSSTRSQVAAPPNSASAETAASSAPQASATPLPPSPAGAKEEPEVSNFGLPQNAQPHKEAQAQQPLTSVRLQVVAAVALAPNRLRIMAANGAVWDQMESVQIGDVKPGDWITIKQSLMGGWICKIADRAPYRCSRADKPSN